MRAGAAEKGAQLSRLVDVCAGRRDEHGRMHTRERDASCSESFAFGARDAAAGDTDAEKKTRGRLAATAVDATQRTAGDVAAADTETGAARTGSAGKGSGASEAAGAVDGADRCSLLTTVCHCCVHAIRRTALPGSVSATAASSAAGAQGRCTGGAVYGLVVSFEGCEAAESATGCCWC